MWFTWNTITRNRCTLHLLYEITINKFYEYPARVLRQIFQNSESAWRWIGWKMLSGKKECVYRLKWHTSKMTTSELTILQLVVGYTLNTFLISFFVWFTAFVQLAYELHNLNAAIVVFNFFLYKLNFLKVFGKIIDDLIWSNKCRFRRKLTDQKYSLEHKTMMISNSICILNSLTHTERQKERGRRWVNMVMHAEFHWFIPWPFIKSFHIKYTELWVYISKFRCWCLFVKTVGINNANNAIWDCNPNSDVVVNFGLISFWFSYISFASTCLKYVLFVPNVEVFALFFHYFYSYHYCYHITSSKQFTLDVTPIFFIHVDFFFLFHLFVCFVCFFSFCFHIFLCRVSC